MKHIFSIFLTLSLLSCGKTIKLISLAKSMKTIQTGANINFTNVSFLFVLDTSGSMSSVHSEMVRNFNYFLPSIQEYPQYAYNFAVTTMSDVKGFSQIQRPLFIARSQDTLHKCGFDSSSPVLRETYVGNYLHYEPHHFKNKNNFDEFLCLFATTVDTITNYGSYGTYGGSEWYFSALDYLLKTKDINFKNHFFSKNNLLVIIFVSDAVGELAETKGYGYFPFLKQVSNRSFLLNAGNIYGKNFFKSLVSYKQDHFIKSYGVIPRAPKQAYGETNCGEIHAGSIITDPAHVASFIQETGGQRFSICDGERWGEHLTVIAQELRKSLKIQDFIIPELPITDSIKVFYNDCEIPNHITQGWYYDPENVSISINSNLNLEESCSALDDKEEDAYRIQYHPLNPRMLSGDR